VRDTRPSDPRLHGGAEPDPQAAYREDPPTDPWGIPAVRGHEHDDLDPPTGAMRPVPGPHDGVTGPFPAVDRDPEPYGDPSRDLYGQGDDDPYAGPYRDADPYGDTFFPTDPDGHRYADDHAYESPVLDEPGYEEPGYDEPGLEQRDGRPASRLGALVVPVGVGIGVSVALGAYARLHEGTGTAINLAGFSSGLAAKSWLTAAAFVFALVQLYSAMRMYGRFGDAAGPRTAAAHRWSGRIAVLLTIPVAVHCLYALGYSDASVRVLAHSLLGCFFYGAFVAKMLLLGRRDAPRWVMPVFGGLVFTALTALFLTSSVWFLSTHGLTF
jgi:hypothetical protein